MTARRTENGLLLGFNQAQSHHIVAIDTCLVGDPRIVDALAGLKRIAAAVCATARPFRLTVLASETGLDVAVEAAGRLSERQRRYAIETILAERAGRPPRRRRRGADRDAPADREVRSGGRRAAARRLRPGKRGGRGTHGRTRRLPSFRLQARRRSLFRQRHLRPSAGADGDCSCRRSRCRRRSPRSTRPSGTPPERGR